MTRGIRPARIGGFRISPPNEKCMEDPIDIISPLATAGAKTLRTFPSALDEIVASRAEE